jgi:hypothetical protein
MSSELKEADDNDENTREMIDVAWSGKYRPQRFYHAAAVVIGTSRSATFCRYARTITTPSSRSIPWDRWATWDAQDGYARGQNPHDHQQRL